MKMYKIQKLLFFGINHNILSIIFICGKANIFWEGNKNMRFFLKNRKKDEDPAAEKKAELMEELKAARDDMEAIYANLSYVIEPDMIDCCIYELNALQLRYKILLNQMKDEEAKACMSIKKEKETADI